MTAVGAGVHMLIQEAAGGGVQSGAAWALDGGAALYLVCLTIAQHLVDDRVDTRLTRTLGVGALLVLAAVATALTPVSLVALSALTLTALVVYETAQA